jgi:cysteinyl-tRNA synthetase
VIAVHYRAPLNHSEASLAAAAAAIERLDAAVAALGAYQEPGLDDAELPGVLESAREAFGSALDDDLKCPAALAALFELVRDLNRRVERRTLSTTDAGSRTRRGSRPRQGARDPAGRDRRPRSCGIGPARGAVRGPCLARLVRVGPVA